MSPSPSDLSLLEKGLSYIPTPRLLPVKDITKNAHQLTRTLKIKSLFRDQIDNTNPNKHKFTEKSTWQPDSNSLSLDTINTVQLIENATKTFLEKHPTISINNENFIQLKEKHNLSADEAKSITNLKKNHTITIKPADKGGATVIMDSDLYKLEAYRQLGNEQYYKQIPGPIFMDNQPKIANILKTMYQSKYINKKQLDYLSGPPDYKQRTFYLLPKIHKKLETWPHPQCPAGRPIVSDVNSESYRISEYIDSFLNPLATKHPSYIKNTYDFIHKIRNFEIPPNALIVTADVESLYTNMNINRSIACVTKQFRENPVSGRPDKQLLELLSLTLNNNDFEFDGKYFLQTCGTAMGKKYAPSLANMYLINFDFKAMNNFSIKPLLYFRYLDDVFFIWVGTVEQLLEYENFLNTLTIGIKIKLEYDAQQANFLDTTIYKTHNPITTLQTKVFFKPTDTHQLLHTQSFHPKHTTRGILKSQLIRFKRISSTQTDYIHTCNILFSALSKRGYTYTFMRKEMYNILHNYTEPNIDNREQQIIPIIINNNTICIKLAHQYREIIKNNTEFDTHKIITAYTNPKNLRQHLVRSKTQPSTLE